MSDREAMNLPIPYIHCDGSVSNLNLVRYESREWFGLQGDNGQSILVQDATHARALARALTIAADLLDSGKGE